MDQGSGHSKEQKLGPLTGSAGIPRLDKKIYISIIRRISKVKLTCIIALMQALNFINIV